MMSERPIEAPNHDKLVLRANIIQAIREYFTGVGFIETDTPSFVYSPGMEPHIRPIRVEGEAAFLPTSPEFAMKRILARGYDKIFQICKAYRYEPKSSTHNPEFAILEWYRSHAGYEEIMNDVEALFEFICKRVYCSNHFETLVYGAQNLSRPWVRKTVSECFFEFAKIDLGRAVGDRSYLWNECSRLKLVDGKDDHAEAWDDLFFRVMMNIVEPALAQLGRPAIIYKYPPSQAALSNVFTDEHGQVWAKRFEVYAGGLELGNAFDELVNPNEQRVRFEKDMALRKQLYGDLYPISPIDEEFLKALSQMPASGGIAMGVDRLVMYFTGAKNIDDVLWLPSYWNV